MGHTTAAKWVLGLGISVPALLATGACSHQHVEHTHSYLIQGPTAAAAAAAVTHVHGKITHDLPIIDGVAADLTPSQLELLERDKTLHIDSNRSVSVTGTRTAASEVQPYVVERTGASQLHAQGITGQGVTIAFLDTGWWSQHAVQNNVAGHNAVLQGYDAIGNKQGVGAPDDLYGHGTHVLSIAVNSARAEDGTFIGLAPNASRVIVRAFDKNGNGTYANAIRGMNWILTNAARYHIRVVNMSFGSPPQSYYWQDPLAQAVMKLWQAGIVVVAAAGNEGPGPQTIDVPGNVPYVITVGASTDNYTPGWTQDD